MSIQNLQSTRRVGTRIHKLVRGQKEVEVYCRNPGEDLKTE